MQREGERGHWKDEELAHPLYAKRVRGQALYTSLVFHDLSLAVLGIRIFYIRTGRKFVA